MKCPKVRKRGRVQKSIGHKIPWKIGMLIYHPVTSRPLIFLQKKKRFYLPVTSNSGGFVTLPALQNNFVNIFFVFAWEFCIEQWRRFLVNFFLISVSHETRHQKSSKNSGKIRSKIRGKIRDENSKNSGNFRSATFLT